MCVCTVCVYKRTHRSPGQPRARSPDSLRESISACVHACVHACVFNALSLSLYRLSVCLSVCLCSTPSHPPVPRTASSAVVRCDSTCARCAACTSSTALSSNILTCAYVRACVRACACVRVCQLSSNISPLRQQQQQRCACVCACVCARALSGVHELHSTLVKHLDPPSEHNQSTIRATIHLAAACGVRVCVCVCVSVCTCVRACQALHARLELNLAQRLQLLCQK
jgi:hypothetical protein